MSRTLLVTVVATFLLLPALALGQTKEPPGYWKFQEVVRVEYPKEKVHKLYPVEFTFEGNKLTVVAKALNANDPKVVHTEEQQVWSWTPPPVILVPGEKVPMTLTLKLDRPKFEKSVAFYIGGGLNAGFLPPKPSNAAVYHVGNDLRTEKGGSGALNPRDSDQGGLNFAPATYTRESFYIVPGRMNRFTVKEHPDRISFRVGGAIGNTREFNTIYEYKWVEGGPPADRGGPAGDLPKDKPIPATVSAGKWDYKVIDIATADVFGGQLEKKLSELGDEGWELVSVVVPPVPINASPTTIRLVFKRPKK